VGWSYLAAINFVETDFGRVIGPSSAGAQGPMQFLPATWARYGRGDIYRPRNAIFAAARFLAGHGAPASIGPALYAYNPSWRYVDAVVRDARQLRAVAITAAALAGGYPVPTLRGEAQMQHLLLRRRVGWLGFAGLGRA
jgi:membrane-bound lytic murein transglycosylase B